MAESNGSVTNGADGSGSKGGVITLESICRNVVEDCLYNIIDDIVRDVHRSEKILRMQSAAAVVEAQAMSMVQSMGSNNSNSKAGGGGGPAPSDPPPLKCSTDAATFDNYRITLKGNPLRTVPEIICPHCKLPRLHHPIAGKRMQAPDLSKEYCLLYPFVTQPGHDIYANPFPTDMSGKTKKEQNLLKKQERSEKDNTPGSQDAGGGGGGRTPSVNGAAGGPTIKLNTGGKPATYIPWHTCPNCKRSILITRFAQHLEKCLGIGGRQSGRVAATLIKGQNGGGNGSGSPFSGSRTGSPAPGSQSFGGGAGGKRGSPVKRPVLAAAGAPGAGADEEEEEEAEVPVLAPTATKKKMKKLGKRGDGNGIGGNKREGMPGKRPPKEKEGGSHNNSGAGGAGGGKREREEDGKGEKEQRERKKMKLLVKDESDDAASNIVVLEGGSRGGGSPGDD